jgi:hypothetical protein
MPLIDITHDLEIPTSVLQRLAKLLPDLVAEQVACEEEPWMGAPNPGDIDIRFRPRSALGAGGLTCVIEVRTKLFPGRLSTKQERAERIQHSVRNALPELDSVGVWLILHEGAWAQ